MLSPSPRGTGWSKGIRPQRTLVRLTRPGFEPLQAGLTQRHPANP
ncbi:hypothetical protein ENTCAN_05368 [Enterobacter cancerogenus ATCC 35316]|nr:hypothetical protein ENTCAN_05368 [Enterobacter cancerogenus ATCC 35316]